jgi:hypothetical protein
MPVESQRPQRNKAHEAHSHCRLGATLNFTLKFILHTLVRT